jgi:membrane protein
VLALPPTLMLLTLLVDNLIMSNAVQEEIRLGLRQLFDENAVKTIFEIAQNVRDRAYPNIWFTIIGIISAWFSATGASAQVHYALNVIWKVRVVKGISNSIFHFIKTRVIAFVTILSIVILAVAGLIITTLVNVFYEFLLTYLSFKAYYMVGLVNVSVSYVFYAIVFAAIFKYVPDVELKWKHVWQGALFTTVLFGIGRYLIGLYMVQLSLYSPYGVAGSLVFLLLWIFYSLQIFFFGATFVQVQNTYKGEKIKPRWRAEYIDSEDDT